MKKVIILIDGENFRFKVEDILTLNKLNINKIDFSRIELDKLINQVFNVFKDLEIVEKRYYSAKIHSVKETESKSKELISLQRRLKKNLIKDFYLVTGFYFYFEKRDYFSERSIQLG